MSEFVKSSVDIDTNIDNVSIALNGLLNLDDNIKTVKYHYELDSKKDQLLKKSQEKQSFRYLYKNVDKFNFDLSKISEDKTKFDYCLEYRKVGTAEKFMIGYTVFILLVFVLLYVALSTMVPIEDSILPMGGLIFVLMALLIGLTCWMIFGKKSTKGMDKVFHRMFLIRLEEYVKIADEHQKRNQRVE